jgi:hypothetical protein
LLEICCKQIRVEGRVVRIARLEGELYVSLKDPDALLQGLQNSGEHVDLFTFMQMLPDTTPKYKFPMEWDNVAALEIFTFDQWWNEQIGKKTRNMARQAEKKGVTLREAPFDDALVRGIWEIYNECPIRQGRRFSHYGKDFETVRRMTATFLDRSIFIGAYFEEKLIGFIKLTANDTGTQAGFMYILSMVKHRDKSPTNALIAEAVRSCAQRGIPYLLYSNFSYGKKQSDSLAEFKERNGFRRIDLPRYYVPITSLGHIALRLGFHQSLASHVPEPILTKVRKWRTAWYKYKFHLEEAI